MDNYTSQTFEVILQRLLDSVPDELDKRQGSIMWDMLAPVAIELELCYKALDNMLIYGVANEHMPSDYLDLRVGEVGITRKPSAKASGQVTFLHGEAGLVVPSGTIVGTDETTPVYFVTQTDLTLSSDGTGTVNAVAQNGGSDGNVNIGEILLVIGDFAGVLDVTNNAVFTGGVDTESDADLLDRYLQKVQEPATSGNDADYVQWAKEVSGVGDAHVYDADSTHGYGAGSVRVVILDSNKRAKHPDIDPIVTNTASYIETVRPVGVKVTVEPATEDAITISATLTLSSGYTNASILPVLQNNLTSYFQSLAFTGEPVRYSRIANIILDIDGVLDYTNLLINGGTQNITVAETHIAVCGTVTLS